MINNQIKQIFFQIKQNILNSQSKGNYLRVVIYLFYYFNFFKLCSQQVKTDKFNPLLFSWIFLFLES